MSHPVDEAIAAAGGILAAQWKSGKNAQMPENDLNPNAQALAFRIKLLEDRCNLLEQTLGQVVRHLQSAKK